MGSDERIPQARIATRAMGDRSLLLLAPLPIDSHHSAAAILTTACLFYDPLPYHSTSLSLPRSKHPVKLKKKFINRVTRSPKSFH